LDELRDFANRRNMGQKLVGGGIKGAAIRGLLGMDAPENATPIQREVYENAARAAAPVMGLAAAPAAIKTAGRALKDAPRAQALETARQNAVKMLGLPENNTAMDRAKALGFDTEGFRGSTTLESTHSKPVWWSEDKDYANTYAREYARWPKGRPESLPPLQENVMPVMVKIGQEKQFQKIGVGGVPDETKFGGFVEGITTGARRYGVDNPNVPIELRGKIWEALTIPQNVRSRFAAFDPARVNENDLLASLAAMGISIPMILGLLDEERVD
jgi:hypothetical protein